MNKVLLFAMLLLPQLLAAQENEGDALPMLETGRSWNYVRTNADGTTDEVSLKLTDAVTIGNETAYKLAYCTPEDTIVRYALAQPDFYMKQLVFSYDLENAQAKQGFLPFMLGWGASTFNWNFGGGTIYEQHLPGKLRVMDEIAVDDSKYKRYTFHDDTEEPADVWMEGVGSMKTGILVGERYQDVVGDDVLSFKSVTDASGNVLFAANDSSNPSASQTDYRPLVEDKKVWYCAEFNSAGTAGWQFQYFTDGDTIVGGQQCLRLYGQNHYRSGITEYLCALYEKDRQVWFAEAGSEEFRLLYDFSMSYDETMTLTFENIRGRSGTMTKRGDNYYIHDGQAWHAHIFNGPCILEGVGSDRGLLMPLLVNITGGYYSLLLCTVDSRVIYDSHEMDRKEVMSVLLKKSDVHHVNTSAVYDLSGHRVSVSSASSVSSVLPKGVYIQGGKKYVIK